MSSSESKTNRKIEEAIAELGRYFNVTSKSAFVDLLIELENRPATNDLADASVRLETLANQPPEHGMGELFLQATEGSLRTAEILEGIKNYLSDSGNENANAARVRQLFEIVWEPWGFDADTGALARCIPNPGGDEYANGGIPGGSYDKDAAGKLAIPGSGPPTDVANESAVDIKNTPSIQGLFWNEALAEQIQENTRRTDRDRFNLSGANADKDEGLRINHADHIASPTKQHPVVSCFMIKDPQLGPANRDTGAVSVFMNFVPTIEMSRCQPYLDVQIISKRPPTFGDNQKINSISLSQFLMGNVETKGMEGTADHIITNAVNASIAASGMYRDDPDTDENEANAVSTAGMELFTAPQMMVDADDVSSSTPDAVVEEGSDEPGGVGSARAAKIIDRFRPLATLKTFSVDVTPTGGMMSHKTAKLSLTLHDRSRLAEIGEFIKPDLYGKVELLVEYGWNHPEGDDLASEVTNPFAIMLNAMRMKEKYKIVNSDFSFDEVGQVEISISLAMVGLMSFDANDISKGPGVKDALKEVQDLLDIIRRVRRQVSPPSEQGASDVQGETWLNSVSSASAIRGMDDETAAAMRAWRVSSRNQVDSSDASPATTELAGALDNLLGPAGSITGGAAANLSTTINTALAWKKAHMTSSEAGDPFWRPILPDTDGFCKVKINCCDPRFDPWKHGDQRRLEDEGRAGIPRNQRPLETFVSLGKVLMTYVAAPLASDEKFDEVQFFFYPFNGQASFMYGRNIAEFPINYKKFTEELAKLQEKTAIVPLRRFLGMIQSKFVNNQNNEAWGLTNLYTLDDEQNQVLREEIDGVPVDATYMHDEKAKRLKAAYTGLPASDETECPVPLKFRKPRIALFTECVPAMNPSEGGDSSAVTTILKVHIYDKACTSYSAIQDLLTAARRNSLGEISTAVRENRPTDDMTPLMEEERKGKIIEAATASGILEEVENPDGREPATVFRVVGGFPKIKQFIKSAMPSIIYGSSTSAVISAKLSSQNDPQLATIHMMRSGMGNARSPAGTRDSGLPLKVTPTTLDLEIMGCPMVNFGQQFFVDFGTGTNVDNVYAVTGVSHALAPGEFKTSLKMTQLDAYGAYESTVNAVTSGLRRLQEADHPPAE